MDAVSRPFVAQKFYNLNPLLEVEVLLRSDYVDVLIEIIGFFSIYGCRDIPCDIEGGACLLYTSRCV